MQLGGAPKCLKCNKEAYFSEQVHAPGGIYHKLCLKCAACSKRLETSTLNENSGNLYCKTCYQKAFGPVGFGNGVFQTQNTMSPVEASAPAASSTVSSVTTSRESLTKSPMVSQGSAKKFSIPSGNTCPSCSKTVYFAEQVKLLHLSSRFVALEECSFIRSALNVQSAVKQ